MTEVTDVIFYFSSILTGPIVAFQETLESLWYCPHASQNDSQESR